MVTRKEIIASLDIGSAQVRCVIGEVNQRGNLNIIGLGSCASAGIKKGTVVDIDSTVQCITQAVEAAQRMAGVSVEGVYVGVPTAHTSLLVSRGIVAVSSDDKEITDEDVERVLQAARVINLPPNREIIDVIPRQFIIDGYEGIRSPAGMAGIRLEVEAMLVTGAMTSVQNLVRCVEKAGLSVLGLVLNAMGLGEAVLSADERELGVLLVDMGGGTCDLAYYYGGALQAIGTIPLGGYHITNDIAYGLRTSLGFAENIKLTHASLQEVPEDKHIQITDVGGQDKRQVSLRTLRSIIEARLNEMLSFVSAELARQSIPEVIPSGVVLTGGVAHTKGLEAYTRSLLKTGVRVLEDGVLSIDDSSYAVSVGIIMYVWNRQMISESVRPGRKEKRTRLLSRVAGWFKEMWE